VVEIPIVVIVLLLLAAALLGAAVVVNYARRRVAAIGDTVRMREGDVAREKRRADRMEAAVEEAREDTADERAAAGSARERMHVAETAAARADAIAEAARRRQANTRVHLERRSNELAEARHELADSRRELEEATADYRAQLRDKLAERDDARRQVVTLGQVVQEIRDRLESATRDAEPGHGGEDPDADVQPEGHGPIDDDDAVLPDTPTHRYVSEEQLTDARRVLADGGPRESSPTGYRFTGENRAEQSHPWDSAPRAESVADALQRVVDAVREAHA
jgi:hypothetical protein